MEPFIRCHRKGKKPSTVPRRKIHKYIDVDDSETMNYDIPDIPETVDRVTMSSGRNANKHVKQNISRTCLQEKAFLYNSTSQSQKYEDHMFERAAPQKTRTFRSSHHHRQSSSHHSNRQSSSYHSRQSSSHHSIPNTAADILPLDSRTANKILSAFARHVEKKNTHQYSGQLRRSKSTCGNIDKRKQQVHDGLDVRNKRIAIISDDHKIAMTPKFRAELNDTAANKYTDRINENANQSQPLTYKLCSYPQTNNGDKCKTPTPKPKKTRENCNNAAHQVPHEKHAQLPGGFDIDSNNQYLAIVPASEIDVFNDKTDTVYGPFYFVKKTDVQEEEDKSHSAHGTASFPSNFTSPSPTKNKKRTVKVDAYKEMPLDINKSKPMTCNGSDTKIEQTAHCSPPRGHSRCARRYSLSPKKNQKRTKLSYRKSPPGSVSPEPSPASVSLRGDLEQGPREKTGQYVAKINNQPEANVTSRHGSPAQIETQKSRDDSGDMKYMKAQVEFLIGVGVNEVKMMRPRVM